MESTIVNGREYVDGLKEGSFYSREKAIEEAISRTMKDYNYKYRLPSEEELSEDIYSLKVIKDGCKVKEKDEYILKDVNMVHMNQFQKKNGYYFAFTNTESEIVDDRIDKFGAQLKLIKEEETVLSIENKVSLTIKTENSSYESILSNLSEIEKKNGSILIKNVSSLAYENIDFFFMKEEKSFLNKEEEIKLIIHLKTENIFVFKVILNLSDAYYDSEKYDLEINKIKDFFNSLMILKERNVY